MGAPGAHLSIAQQENLLVLLAFSESAAPRIRNSVDVHLFSNAQYRAVVSRIYEFLDAYKKPPGEHLPDLFEEELAKRDPEAELLLGLLQAVGDRRTDINEEYTLRTLEAFVRQQTMKVGIIQASEAVQDGDLDGAERFLIDAMKARMQVFEGGMTLEAGLVRALEGTVRSDIVPTGIKELDRAGLGVARGEFHLFIGPPKKGKSWWLINMGKQALLHKFRVLYLTLELSEAQIAQRFLQALFSLSQHKADVAKVVRLHADKFGQLMRFEHETLSGRMSLEDDKARAVVSKKLQGLHSRNNLVIKQFPAGQLTMRGLQNYVDMLEQQSGFIPDVVLLDYADYMAISAENYRLESMKLYNDLRGFAVEHNVALATASRSNREGAKAGTVKGTHAGEDFSRVYTADTILTYSQSGQEKNLGLARILADATRVANKDGFTTLISQAYTVGQFCLDSAYLSEKYNGLLELAAGRAPEGEEDATA